MLPNNMEMIIKAMAEWKKRGKKRDDVIHFPYVPEEDVQNTPLVYLWDVDKTYLDTKFETIKGLWRTATEKAQAKRNVPGTAELVRCLNDAWQGDGHFPIFFITASPPQIEHKIYMKLKLDGVQPYGIFCKDNLENLRPKRLWRITKHVGYKLQALMQMRAFLKEDVKVVMFGDDGESDANIYSLFSDICTRRIDSGELRKILNHFSVLDDQVDTILHLRDLSSEIDPVEKIYINLAEDTDSDYYLKFGRRIVPAYDSFQIAVDLFQDKRIGSDHVLRVAKRLMADFEYSAEQIEKSFDDFVRRDRVSAETAVALEPVLKKAELLASDYAPSVPPKPVKERLGDTVVQLEGNFEAWVPERVDYLHDYR